MDGWMDLPEKVSKNVIQDKKFTHSQGDSHIITYVMEKEKVGVVTTGKWAGSLPCHSSASLFILSIPYVGLCFLFFF